MSQRHNKNTGGKKAESGRKKTEVKKCITEDEKKVMKFNIMYLLVSPPSHIIRMWDILENALRVWWTKQGKPLSACLQRVENISAAIGQAVMNIDLDDNTYIKMNDYLQATCHSAIFDLERDLSNALPNKQANATIYQLNILPHPSYLTITESLRKHYPHAFVHEARRVNGWSFCTAKLGDEGKLMMETGIRDFLIKNKIKPLPHYYYNWSEEERKTGANRVDIDIVKPAHENAKPDLENNSELDIKNTVPAHEKTKPDGDNTEPDSENTGPAHENTVPAHENTVPAQENTVPALENTVHKQENTVHAQKNTVPVLENTVPAQENTVPAQENTVPAQENKEPVLVNTRKEGSDQVNRFDQLDICD